MRRRRQRAGRKDHHIVEAHRVPVDLAQRRDPRLDLAAQDRHGDAIADPDVQRPGLVGVQRHQRRPDIIARPPASLHDLAPLGQGGAIGDAALAAQDPRPFRLFLQVSDALARIAGHRATQDRHDVQLRRRHAPGHQSAKLRLRPGRHVEYEQVRRLFRHGPADLRLDAGLDRRQRDEQGQCQPQCHRQRRRLRAGPMEVGERQPQQRPPRMGHAPRQPPYPLPHRQQQQQGRRNGAQHGRGEHRRARRQQHDRDQQRDRPADQRQRVPVDPSPPVDQGAQDRRHRLGPRTGERRQGEDQRDQQAIGGARHQRQWIEMEARRHRQHVARRPDQQGWRQRARHQPGQYGQPRNHPDLEQIDALDIGRSRPQHLEGRQRTALDRQIGRDAIADADPGNHQRGEADQRQELAHILDEAVGARRCPLTVLIFPALLDIALLQPLAQRLRIRPGGQAQPIFGAVEAARLDQPGAVQPVHRHDRHRPQGKALAHPVRLVGDDGGHGEIGRAIAQRVTDADRHPLGQGRADQDAVGGQRRIAALLQRQRAIERIGIVHTLQLGQQRRRPARPALVDHGAQPHRLARPAQPRDRLLVARVHHPLGHGDLDIAAQDHLPARRNLAGDRAGQAADRRQRHHAQEQADEQQPQAAEPGMQVAPRDPPACPPPQCRHAATSPLNWPSRISTVRSHRAANAGSWVMISRVAPLACCRANSRSMIAVPVAWSRLPVGSSANNIAGSGAMARAIATRCCSPPDSWAG